MGVVDWSFQIWYVKDNCRIETKLEQLNTMINCRIVRAIHGPTICNVSFEITNEFSSGTQYY